MKPNSTTKVILDVATFLIAFILIQFVIEMAVYCGYLVVKGTPVGQWGTALPALQKEMDGNLIALSTSLSSVLTMALFIWRKWSPVSRVYLASHPWATLTWVALLTLGYILPAEWAQEKLNLVMPELYNKLFANVMGKPVGYLAVGILAPLAEELVFRGAILRSLLNFFGQKRHWIAIVISALLFGCVHGNLPQFIHGTIIGLLLGWMYYRTDSIIPGIVLHWINNTVAYVMFNLMPQMADGKLIDLFHGDEKTMTLGIIFSLCIFFPSLFQLSFRLKKNQ